MEFKLESDKTVVAVGLNKMGTSDYSEAIHPLALYLSHQTNLFPLKWFFLAFRIINVKNENKDIIAQFLKINLYANIVHMRIGRKSL